MKLLLGLALSLLPFCLAAQDEAPKRAKETLALIDRARALPPEFCADILLKLAGSNLIPDKKWKLELLEEAFLAGSHAQLPYARAVYYAGVESKSSQEYARNGLEALTLQTRAAEAMLAVDPARAAPMFQDIAFPDLPKEKCEEIAVPAVEPYYTAAVKIFAEGFTAKQRQKEEDLHFLEDRIARMHSPAQVPFVMRMIYQAQTSGEQRKRLLTGFAVVLDRVNGGDREFGAFDYSLTPAASPELAQNTMLLTALRSYIVRQMRTEQCADHIKKGQLPGSVNNFNGLAERLDPAAAWLKPIGEEEATPAKVGARFVAEGVYASQRAKQVMDALRWLNHGETNPVRQWTAEERKSAAWMEHFMDLLKLIEGWKEEEESSPEEYLINVSQTYASLAADAPPGAAKEQVMGRYVNFIETRYEPAGKRNLWFSQVKALLDRARRAKDEAEREWILERLGRSRNPVISLYTQMETVQ